MHIELTLDKSIVINTRRNCGSKRSKPFIIPFWNLVTVIYRSLLL